MKRSATLGHQRGRDFAPRRAAINLVPARNRVHAIALPLHPRLSVKMDPWDILSFPQGSPWTFIHSGGRRPEGTNGGPRAYCQMRGEPQAGQGTKIAPKESKNWVRRVGKERRS